MDDYEDWKLRKQFEAFHEENPWVYRRIKEMTMDLYNRGVNRYGIAALFEVLRYERTLKTNSADEFKLCNNHRAFYARAILDDPDCKVLRNCFVTKNGQLRDFFLLRRQYPRGTQRYDRDMSRDDELGEEHV